MKFVTEQKCAILLLTAQEEHIFFYPMNNPMVKNYYKEENVMTLIPLKTLNQEARDNLNDWYHNEAMEPNLKLVAKRIGLGYGTLKQFKVGTDVTYQNIYKIISFLETQGYKLKEKA